MAVTDPTPIPQTTSPDQPETTQGLSRRRFLRGAGVVTVLVAGGGVWRAGSQHVFSPGTGPAYEPWDTWRTDRPEGALGVVHAGILAANPHNTQPWIFRIQDDTIDVLADTARNLGTFDPYLREMHIGLGCALENMSLAARALGFTPAVTLSGGTLGPIATQPEPQLVATLALAPAAPDASPLFTAIPDRHTNRGAYDTTRPLGADDMGALERLAADSDTVRLFMFHTATDRATFGHATVEATAEIVADPRMVHDSHAWFRNSWRDVQTHRDGIALDSVGMPPLITAAAKMLPPLPQDQAHRAWLRSTETVHCATAAAFGFLAVRDLYDRAQTLAAGRVWQRLHLLATTRGVAMHPINQAVEMVDRQRQLGQESTWARRLAELLGGTDWRPTFAFRTGYPVRAASASPRRTLHDVLA